MSVSEDLAIYYDAITDKGMGSEVGADELIEIYAEECRIGHSHGPLGRSYCENQLVWHINKLITTERVGVHQQRYSDALENALLLLLQHAGVDLETLTFEESKSKKKASSSSRSTNKSISRAARSSSHKESKKSTPGKKGEKILKIKIHKGHHFLTTSFQKPTFCGHCQKLLWGITKQGWECQLCGFTVHKANDHTGHRSCHKQLATFCPGMNEKEETKAKKKSAAGGGGDSSEEEDSPGLLHSKQLDLPPSPADDPATW